MYYGLTFEQKKDLIMEKAMIKRRAAAIIRQVREKATQFDGKVYNKKFDDAVEALTDDLSRLNCYNSYGWFYIDYIPTDTKDNYRNKQSLLAAYSCKASEQRGCMTREENKVFDDKRINAAKMGELLNNKREELLKEAYTLETIAEELETVVAQYEQIERIKAHLVESVPYEIREICGLKR